MPHIEDTVETAPQKMYVAYLGNKDNYRIFKICCTICILFATNYCVSHNFIFVFPCIVHSFYKKDGVGIRKNLNVYPQLIKVKPPFYVPLFNDPFGRQFKSFRVLNFFSNLRMRHSVLLSKKADKTADPQS